MSKVKRFYWQIRATKGKNLIAILKAFFLEVYVKNFYRAVKRQVIHVSEQRFLVSLTSYPPRFDKLYLTLLCLLNQSVTPYKIVLWVTEEDYNILPAQVLKLQSSQLIDINFSEDFGPGKKILPALKMFPECFIVTCDDDCFYYKRWLEDLIHTYNSNHGQPCIVAHRIHEVVRDEFGNIAPYMKWNFDVEKQSDSRVSFFTGGAGVLFPPDSLDERVLDTHNYRLCCLKQDDIWLNWMAKLAGTKVVKVSSTRGFVSWNGSDDNGLFIDNAELSGNDLAINKVVSKYGDVYNEGRICLG